MKKLTTILIIILYNSFVFGQNEYYESIILSRYTKQVNNKYQISINNFELKEEKIIKDTLAALEKYAETEAFQLLDRESIDQIISYIEKSNVELKKINKQKQDTLISIITKYFGECTENASTINTAFQENPYFANFEYSGNTKGESGFKINSKLNFGTLTNTANISSFDVTNISKGIALFMIDRAEQELTAAFFERFKNYMQNNPEIQVLFPKTTSALNNLLSYHYTEMLPVLRQTFYEDLKLIPIRINDIFELPEYRPLIAEFPEIQISFRTISLIYSLEDKNSHPAEILNEFASFPEWNKESNNPGFKNFGNSVKTANIFSNSLRKYPENPSDVWINIKDINELVKNETSFRIYIGLTYQTLNSANISFISNKDGSIISLSAVMSDNKENIFMFQNYISEFILLTEKVEKQIESFNIKDGKKHTNEDFYEYIKTSIDVIEYGFKITHLLNKDIEYNNFLVIATSANDLYKNIYEENYSGAVSNVVTIIKTTCEIINVEINTDVFKQSLITDLNSLPEIKDYNPASFAKKVKNPEFEWTKNIKSAEKELKVLNNIEDKQFTASEKQKIDNVIDKISAILKSQKLEEAALNIRKYGVFMANVVNADSPEEVQNVIEAAVLPVGSSSLKKHSDFNISVQSYLGASYNLNAKSNFINAWNGKVGITAPIGFSFNYGFNNRGSLGLFISILDLGAIVDYEYSTDTSFSSSVSTASLDTTTIATVNTNNEYKIELGQIFSPGCFLTYGFPIDIPLSLSVGAQYGPGLIKIGTSETKLSDPDWRFVITLTVDIPWFTIYNIEKKKVN